MSTKSEYPRKEPGNFHDQSVVYSLLLVVWNSGCPLASPEKLLEPTMPRPHPSSFTSESLKVELKKKVSGNHNLQSSLKSTVLAELVAHPIFLAKQYAF